MCPSRLVAGGALSASRQSAVIFWGAHIGRLRGVSNARAETVVICSQICAPTSSPPGGAQPWGWVRPIKFSKSADGPSRRLTCVHNSAFPASGTACIYRIDSTLPLIHRCTSCSEGSRRRLIKVVYTSANQHAAMRTRRVAMRRLSSW